MNYFVETGNRAKYNKYRKKYERITNYHKIKLVSLGNGSFTNYKRDENPPVSNIYEITAN